MRALATCRDLRAALHSSYLAILGTGVLPRRRSKLARRACQSWRCLGSATPNPKRNLPSYLAILSAGVLPRRRSKLAPRACQHRRCLSSARHF